MNENVDEFRVRRARGQGSNEPLDVSGYAVYASVALVPTVHGARGPSKCCRTSASPRLRDYIAGGVDAVRRTISSASPWIRDRPAVVRMSDASGRVAVRRLRRELAFLRPRIFTGAQASYLVAVDLGRCGSGPRFTPRGGRHGTLQWPSAIVASDGRRFEITHFTSRRLAHRSTGRGREKDLIFVEGGVAAAHA